MRQTLFIAVLLSVINARSESAADEPPTKVGLAVRDSSAAQSLRARYPHLWRQVRQDVAPAAARSDSAMVDSLTVAKITASAPRDSAGLRKLDDRIAAELYYLDKKYLLDRAQSKYVLTPYHINYAYFDMIADSARSGEYIGNRMALKWQMSVQFPFVVAKYYSTGLFFAFTNKSLFDLINGKESSPVAMKTFMPEVFGRFDFASLGNRGELADKYVMQLGAEHESNGGYNGDTTIYQSRGILANFYAEMRAKFFPNRIDDRRKYLLEDRYALIMYLRLVYPFDYSDNPDICSYVGWVKTYGSLEMPIVAARSFGIVMLDWLFIPGGKANLTYATWAVGLSYTLPMYSQTIGLTPKIPMTPYVRLFQGYNEFLETYNRKTIVYGFGLRFRR